MIKHIEEIVDLFVARQIGYTEVIARLTSTVFYSFLVGITLGIFITIVLYATR